MYINTSDTSTAGDTVGWQYVEDTTSTATNPLFNGNLGNYDGVTINYPKHGVSPNNIRDWYNDLGADNTKDIKGSMRCFYATAGPEAIETQYYDGTQWCTIS